MPKTTRSIGQVLATVRLEFPDVSISKIRFLEAEGLLAPERAPSGFRKYGEEDVERLRYILRVQRDHYLPLKVIREHLDLLDRGLTPPPVEAPGATRAAVEVEPEPARARAGRAIALTRQELMEQSGITEPALRELEREFLVQPQRGTGTYGREALTVVVVARRLAACGLDARHLRAVKQAAERELGLIEQAIAPYVRRSPTARETTAEVTQLVALAHTALMRAALDRSQPPLAAERADPRG